MSNARVTVTLPSEVVHAIDREEHNRSRFVLNAVTRELDRRRNEQLRKSLSRPHPESIEMAEVGFATWAEGLGDAPEISEVHAVAGERSELLARKHGKQRLSPSEQERLELLTAKLKELLPPVSVSDLKNLLEMKEEVEGIRGRSRERRQRLGLS